MGVAPLLADNLGIEGIGADLAAVVIGAAVPLAFRLTAHELSGTKRRRLKDLLAVRATAITPRLAPDENR